MHLSGTASFGGRRFVQVALMLFLAPTAVAFLMVAQAATSLVSWVLVSAAIAAFLAVRCYRGDVWARWLITGVLSLAVVQALTAVTARGVPQWVAFAQLLWSALTIGLLQAPASRSFLRERYTRRTRGV